MIVRTIDGESSRFVATPGDAPTRNLSFSPDGKLLAVVKTDGSVQLFASDTLNLLQSFEGISAQADSMFGIAFSPDGKLLATSDADEPIRLWRVPTDAPAN